MHFFLSLLLQQKMKIGPLVARVLKLFLHFHLVFTTGITFNYLLKVKWYFFLTGYWEKVCTSCLNVISFTEISACQWERLHTKVSGGQIWPEHNNVSLTAWTEAWICFGMATVLRLLWVSVLTAESYSMFFSVNLSPTSFCAKRASSRLGRTYFYGWHRPQSFPSTSWFWECAYCPPCRPFTDDLGAARRLIDWASFGWATWLCSWTNAFLLFYSGEPLKTSHRLEDGQIGGQPEVIYHVFHTLLFGGLTLLFDGCVNISASSSGVFHDSRLTCWLHKKYVEVK